ncbi:ankyrin repeat-containing domain protein [Hypomontagnella submonticulosa]|nr:ankyrin repeat-containing domain protein [Hypomontagnella submonticulosa]
MGAETALELAAKVALPDVVELLLQHGATLENRAALHYATMDDRIDIAAVLLHHGQDANVIPDDEEIPTGYYERGWGTALHEAARKGHEHMVRFLLGYGIDAALEDNYGKTAPEVAVDNQHEDVAHVISDTLAIGADPIGKEHNEMDKLL